METIGWKHFGVGGNSNYWKVADEGCTRLSVLILDKQKHVVNLKTERIPEYINT